MLRSSLSIRSRSSGNSQSSDGDSADSKTIKNLQYNLANPPLHEDGYIELFLQGQTRQTRRRVFEKDPQLARDLCVAAVKNDHGKNAAYLGQVLQGECGVQPVAPAQERSRLSVLHRGNPLGEAAYILSSANLAGAYFRQGMLPNIAREQLMAGQLPYAEYAADFPGAGPEVARELLEAGHLSLRDYFRAPGVNADEFPALAMEQLKRGAIDLRTYLDLGFTLAPTDPNLRDLVELGVVTPLQYLRLPEAQEADCTTLVQNFVLDGQLTFEEALPHVGVLDLEGAQFYVDLLEGLHGRAPQETWSAWLLLGKIVDEDIGEGVRRGLFTAEHVATPGHNQFALVKHLVQEGQLQVEDAVADLVEAWEPKHEFPAFLIRYLQDRDMFPSHDDLMATVPLPGPPGHPQNAAFLLRAGAVWICAEAEARPAPASRAASARQAAPAEATECVACIEPFSLTREKFKLEACEHPARMDLDCFYEGLAANGGWRCPDADCNRRLDPNEVLGLKGLAGAAASALSQLTDFRATRLPNWLECPTDKCPGGASVAVGQHVNLSCRCCGEQSLLYKKVDGAQLVDAKHVNCGCHPHQGVDVVAQRVHVDLPALTEGRMKEIEQNVEMWTNPPRNPDSGGRGQRPIGPCFFDSGTVMHKDACQHMTHSGQDGQTGGCGHEIHQSDGPYLRSQHNGLYNYGPIRYVPYGVNLVVQYGLFEPYKPGFYEPPGEEGRRRQNVVAQALRQNVQTLRQRFDQFQAEQARAQAAHPAPQERHRR